MTWIHDIERFEAREAERDMLPDEPDVPPAHELRELEKDQRRGYLPPGVEEMFAEQIEHDRERVERERERRAKR